MRVELTVRRAERHADVAICAAEPVPLAGLAPELAEIVGASAAGQVWLGDDPIDAAALVGRAGLTTGAVLDLGRPSRARVAAGVLALHQVGGPDAGRVVALERGCLVLGRDAECEVPIRDVDASRRHARVEVSAGAITVHDLGSTNGTLVDGARVGSAGRAVRPGELIRIGDCTFTVAVPADTPAALSDAQDGSVRVLRPPRRVPRVEEREIAVPVRSAAMGPRGVQWVAALLPAVAGGGIAWATHSAQFLLFALLSPVMMLSTSLGDRVHWRRSRRREAATYARSRAAAERDMAAALRAETAARRSAAPDPATVGRLAALPGSRLWERRLHDADFLSSRLGTADLPSTTRRHSGSDVKPAGTVVAVPACVSLRAGPLGMAGPPLVIAGLARWVVGQLAALHSPADLEIALLLSPDVEQQWRWCRWLPHVRGRVATAEDEWAPLVAELGADVDRRLAARRLDPDGWSGPWRYWWSTGRRDWPMSRASRRCWRAADLPG